MRRRTFIKNTAAATAGTAFYMSSGQTLAYAPSETINMAMIGCGGRSYALKKSTALAGNIRLTHACEVDKARLDRFVARSKEDHGWTLKAEKDFRKILDDKDVDAVAIATPDHWHAPMAIMALKAGKAVYIEKPCSHNLQESEWLVKAAEETGLPVQMGNQQRSSVTTGKAHQRHPRGYHWGRLLRQGLVRQYPWLHRQRPEGGCT